MSEVFYVLCFGERHEGHCPEAAFKTLDAAKAAAAGGGRYAAPVESWEAMNSTTWRATVGGCDEWWIYAMRVTS